MARYGDFVLLDPPFKAKTLLLWCGPAVLLLLGAGGIYALLRRRQDRAPEPLSEAERSRLAELMAETAERRGRRGSPAKDDPALGSGRPALPGVVAVLALPLLGRRAAVGADRPRSRRLSRPAGRARARGRRAACCRRPRPPRHGSRSSAGCWPPRAQPDAAAQGGRGHGAARAWLGAGLLLLLLPAATVAIYLDVGSPDLPAFPSPMRTAAPAPAGNQQMARRQPSSKPA